MIIANFTPDTIQWMHVGQVGKLKPDDVGEFPDNRAKHILNRWGPRGLLQIGLNDNREAKRVEAMEIYKQFWFNQISNFNQMNEVRKVKKN